MLGGKFQLALMAGRGRARELGMTQDKEALRTLGKELHHLSPDLVSQCRAYLQAAGYNDFADAFEAKQGAARVPVPPLLLGMVAAILTSNIA